MEVTGEGLLLTVAFDADGEGVGGSTKAADAEVPANFRPRFAIQGPGL